MDRKSHWENVYHSKNAKEVSWFAPHLSTSLSMIKEVSIKKDSPIIDVGGGASTLVDDLLQDSFSNINVLDVSSESLEVSRKRLKGDTEKVNWIVSDITSANLPHHHFGLWHDRAVFHFLTNLDDRKKYMEVLWDCLKPEGFAIISTFSLQGPEKCSGLNIIRYSPETLLKEFGPGYQLVTRTEEAHQTPFGTVQKFIYCLFQKT